MASPSLSVCCCGAEFMGAVLEMGVGVVAESDSVTPSDSYDEGGVKSFLQQHWDRSPSVLMFFINFGQIPRIISSNMSSTPFSLFSSGFLIYLCLLLSYHF